MHLLASSVLTEILFDQISAFRCHHFEKVKLRRVKLCPSVSHDLLASPIGVHHPPLPVDEDHVRRLLRQAPELLLALSQCLFRKLSLGDIQTIFYHLSDVTPAVEDGIAINLHSSEIPLSVVMDMLYNHRFLGPPQLSQGAGVLFALAG